MLNTKGKICKANRLFIVNDIERVEKGDYFLVLDISKKFQSTFKFTFLTKNGVATTLLNEHWVLFSSHNNIFQEIQ